MLGSCGQLNQARWPQSSPESLLTQELYTVSYLLASRVATVAIRQRLSKFSSCMPSLSSSADLLHLCSANKSWMQLTIISK